MNFTTNFLINSLQENIVITSSVLDESDCCEENKYKSYFSYKRLVNSKKINLSSYCKTNNNSILFLEDEDLYTTIGNYIPIPCLDFILTYQSKDTLRATKNILLVKRKNWPMAGYWWPIGGRRVLPELSSFEWSILEDIYWRIYNDLGIRNESIISVQKIIDSDHFHFYLNNEQVIKKRVTPVNTFVIEVEKECIDYITLPKEASCSKWFSKESFIDTLDSSVVCDHLKIIGALIFNVNIELELKYHNL